jgi:hypothetical protein
MKDMDIRLAGLLSLADAPSVDVALGPWLGMTVEEADRYAADSSTQDGLDRERLQGLLTILSLGLPDPKYALLASTLMRTCAPTASDVYGILEAMRIICAWRSGIDDATMTRIIAAKRAYEDTWAALAMAGMNPGPEESLSLLASMDDVPEIDHAVVPLGGHDVIVEMTSESWIVGILKDGRLHVMDVIAYGGGGGPDDDDDGPTPDPTPRLLIDA